MNRAHNYFLISKGFQIILVLNSFGKSVSPLKSHQDSRAGRNHNVGARREGPSCLMMESGPDELSWSFLGVGR